MRPIRVLHFGLGPIGAAIVKQVAARPGFKIVGGVDIDPAKAGRDLGDIVGLSKRLDVKVSSDAARALNEMLRERWDGVEIAHQYELADIAAAHAHAESRRGGGRIVLTIGCGD